MTPSFTGFLPPVAILCRSNQTVISPVLSEAACRTASGGPHHRQLTRQLLAGQIRSSSRKTRDLRFPIGSDDSQMGSGSGQRLRGLFRLCRIVAFAVNRRYLTAQGAQVSRQLAAMVNGV